MRLTHVVLLALLAISSISTLHKAQAQVSISDMTARVPDRANTILIMDVDKILRTPLAQKDNWIEKRANAAASGLTILPLEATQFLMAAEMDFDFMQPTWEVALARMKKVMPLPQVAARWNGEIDRIGERSVVRLPEDAYLVQFNKKLVGGYRPANRQRVTKWLRGTDNSRVGARLSPYIETAINFVSKGGTPIVLAMDLSDMVSVDAARKRLSEFDAVKGHEAEIDQIVEQLSSIQGVTLGITIKDRVHAAVLVDFSKPLNLPPELAKSILLEVLARNSATIDEFAEWTPTIEGNRFKLGGYLGRSGLQRILSILDAPIAMQTSPSPYGSSPGEQPDPQEVARLASQQYFQSVDGLLNDLKGKPKGKDSITMGQIGIWAGRYAEKIDRLPLLNVDSELLNYGGYVSQSLRGVEKGLRDVGGRSRVRELNVPAQYNYAYAGGRWGRGGRYGGYGGGGRYGYVYGEDVRAEQAERVRVRTEERIGGASGARNIMQEISGATADIRRKMTKKYQVEF